MNDLTVLIKAGHICLPLNGCPTVSIFHFLNQDGEKVIIKLGGDLDYYERPIWTATIDGSQQRGKAWLHKYCMGQDPHLDCSDILYSLDRFVFFGSKDEDSTIDFSTFVWAKGIAERRQNIENEIFDISIV